MSDSQRHLWWQQGIIYQIYPRSFQDSNGDGVGDLPGITDRLDYLQWLGIDAIWISPIFPSPMADFGYDVADYCGIHPVFGRMDDFDHLLEEAHRRELKLLLDFVPNHTSDQHPWFVESRSSRDNPMRDWYLWYDPAPDGGPPSNWRSVFRGSAWEFDETTGQYYYHAFLKEQPDLNWRNPDVQQAMFDAMRFWLDKGVDGFRVDVMWHMIKDDQLRDNPKNPDFQPDDPDYRYLLPSYTTDQPEVHEIVRKMRRITDAYDERVLIGEIYLPPEQLVTYYGDEGDEAHMPFNFALIYLPWNARKIDAAINEYEGALPDEGWPNWVLGNHDKPRVASRLGPAQARIAAMLLLTLRGTPTIYYGDEIGMTDVPIPPELMHDPQGLRQLDKQHSRDPLALSRDPERTPMQWSASEKAGFTTGMPWLPIADEHTEVNVEVQREDLASMLTFYRYLIDLRRREPALAVGAYRPVNADGDILAYERSHYKRRFLVVLNLGHEPQLFPLQNRTGRLVVSTHLDRRDEQLTESLQIRADEGIIIQLDAL